jgi:predicted transposase YdaD
MPKNEDKHSFINHDRLFKQVLQEFFIEFLELFFPEVAAFVDRKTLIGLDKEIFTDVTSGETHEVDILFRAKFHDSEKVFLLHVESQSYKQENFGSRMHQYYSRLRSKYLIPVCSFAVFSYKTPYDPELGQYVEWLPHRKALEYNYDVLQLNLLDWKNYLNRPNPLASALMSKMRIVRKDRVKVKIACLKMLAGLELNRAQKRLLSGFIDTYLDLNTKEQQNFEEELVKEPFEEQEKIMELTTSWKEEGIKIGRAEGKAEGRREMVLEQLNFRFGELKTPFRKQILALSEAKIQELAKAIFEFKSLNDLTSWLDQNQGS